MEYSTRAQQFCGMMNGRRIFSQIAPRSKTFPSHTHTARRAKLSKYHASGHETRKLMNIRCISRHFRQDTTRLTAGGAITFSHLFRDNPCGTHGVHCKLDSLTL